MELKKLEGLIEDKVVKGEMPCGLFDTGVQIVRVYLGGDDFDTVCFEWFPHPEALEAYLIANDEAVRQAAAKLGENDDD